MSDEIVLTRDNLKHILKLKRNEETNDELILKNYPQLTEEFLKWFTEDKIEIWLRKLSTEGIAFLPLIKA